MFIVPIIGDAHFKSDARQQDRLASVDQIIAENLTAPVGAWAVPGDLFDKISDPASRNAWADRLIQMANVAPVVGCYGNHDADGDLYVLSQLRAKYPIVMCHKPTLVPVMTPQGIELTVFVLPYPHPSGLVAEGTPVSEVIPAARAMLDVIFMQHGASLVMKQKQKLPTLFVGHANVGGSKMSTGQPLIGREIELDEAMMLRLGNCPKILNHIHLPQEIGGAMLTGSVTAMSWGETEAKRYITVSYEFGPCDECEGEGSYLDAHDFRSYWTKCPECDGQKVKLLLYSVRSCPLRTPQLVLVEATFDHYEFRYSIDPADVPAGSDVRVRVTFQEPEREFFEFGKMSIKEQFAHARRLDIEPICVPDKGLRSPQVAAEKTLPGKIRAWAQIVGMDVPDDLETAVGELETKPSDQVVSEFRSRMEALLKEASHDPTRTPDGARDGRVQRTGAAHLESPDLRHGTDSGGPGRPARTEPVAADEPSPPHR